MADDGHFEKSKITYPQRKLGMVMHLSPLDPDEAVTFQNSKIQDGSWLPSCKIKKIVISQKLLDHFFGILICAVIK